MCVDFAMHAAYMEMTDGAHGENRRVRTGSMAKWPDTDG
jgi:hypothetical protein